MPDIFFNEGDWLRDRHNLGRPGRFTGRVSPPGGPVMLQLEYGPHDLEFRPLDSLERVPARGATPLRQMLLDRRLGQLADLRRLITFEKLKGSLDEIIYSMEAAQIDFLPYQFKPVLKFTQSPTQRLLLADEVGLGKTIESGLIWLEMQARYDAKRLLVVCKRTLCHAWRNELRTKFGIDAVEMDGAGFCREMERFQSEGRDHRFALIVSYDAVRAKKAEWAAIDGGDTEEELSAKGRVLRDIKNWQESFPGPPFDLVIFDEAALMKNPAAMRSRTGRLLANSSEGALVVTATPLMVHQEDLRSLLRLVDEDFFSNPHVFEALISANRPAVRLANALARIPPNLTQARADVEALKASQFVGNSPLLPLLDEHIQKLSEGNICEQRAALVSAQRHAEQLNVLGGFLTRTRRVQVEELRTVRVVKVLPVEFSPEEKKFYWAVVEFVRRKALQDARPFHIFQVIGLQMRAASCLPALAEELRSEATFTDDGGEMLSDAFDLGDEDWDEDCAPSDTTANPRSDFAQILSLNYEANDRKFAALESFLNGLPSDEKVIIFAYYRGTLLYLERRLRDKFHAELIHGGVHPDDRIKSIARFESDRRVRILLSSEVGSEGLNLQFARVVVNYDLPWNPMKVEQRIGRVDRVGQRSATVTIVHFKVAGTIEERLHDRLRERLEQFRNSIGDLEEVLGKEIQQLTVDLVTGPLTEAAMNDRIEASANAAETRLRQIEDLETHGEGLLAFSDFLQERIRNDLRRDRYLTPDELEEYVRVFFDRQPHGNYLEWGSPAAGCLKIRLSSAARQSLDNYLGSDPTQRARAVRGHEFSITFRRKVIETLPPQQRRSVSFINHLSPLIRWITNERMENGEEFVPAAAMKLATIGFQPGIWVFRIERWRFKGLRRSEVLAFGACSIDGSAALSRDDAERLVGLALRDGESWPYPNYPAEDAVACCEALEQFLATERSAMFDAFAAENSTTTEIRKQRIEAQKNRELASIQQALNTQQERGRSEAVIELTRQKLARTCERFDGKLRELCDTSASNQGYVEVAIGVCLVTNS